MRITRGRSRWAKLEFQLESVSDRVDFKELRTENQQGDASHNGVLSTLSALSMT